MTNNKDDSAMAGVLKANQSQFNVAVVGARGYSGLELCRILLKHPRVKLLQAVATQKNWDLKSYLPELYSRQSGNGSSPGQIFDGKGESKNYESLGIEDLQERLIDKKIDIGFLATPAKASMELVSLFKKSNVPVIDLSGAFRLPKDTFERWYPEEHSLPELLDEAWFGLQPFSSLVEGGERFKNSGFKLISNPGCYATSVMMALKPLLSPGVIDSSESIIVDAKSGTSGAGKKALESMLMSEVYDDFYPYKVGKHQHTPEIIHHLENLTGVSLKVTLTTHLLPLKRGILSSIYCKLSDGKVLSDILESFEKAFENYSLAQIFDLGDSSVTTANMLKKVKGSAQTHIYVYVDGCRLTIFSVIDNLMKGAASQAVENFNFINGDPIDLGLKSLWGHL